jgi:DNA-binding GntR family transcriptional regulator
MIARNLEKTAYESILMKLLDGRLTRGAVVSEAALAKDLGISRTPVRHAIRQLEAQGLVEQIPKLGTIARPPDRREIAEIFDTREAIEAHIAAAAAGSISSVHLDELQRQCERLLAIGKEFRSAGVTSVANVSAPQKVAWFEADLGFHRILLDAVNNRRLTRVYADLQLLTHTCSSRVIEYLYTPIQGVARAYREHVRILRLIRRHDVDGARREMIAHIRRKKATTLEQLMRQESVGTPQNEIWGRETDVMELFARLEGATQARRENAGARLT